MTSPFGKARLVFVSLFVLLAVNFLAAQGLRPDAPGALDRVPDGAHGQGVGVMAPAPSGGSVVQGNGINYHNGPVLQGNPVPIYLIWYGNWTSRTGPNSQETQIIVSNFLASFGGSWHTQINYTYGGVNGTPSGDTITHHRDSTGGTAGVDVSGGTTT